MLRGASGGTAEDFFFCLRACFLFRIYLRPLSDTLALVSHRTLYALG